MKALLVFASLLLLVGCEQSPPYDPTHLIVTPDGHSGYTIRCDDQAECYQWASLRCPRGYGPISETNYDTHEWSFGRSGAFAAGGSRSTHHQVMVIECKGGVINQEAIHQVKPCDPLMMSNAEYGGCVNAHRSTTYQNDQGEVLVVSP